MAKGKAYGLDRDYQMLCRDLLQVSRNERGLEPYAGDGIDVPIKTGAATWTFDVALRSTDGGIVVAECKRWKDPVDQTYIAAFSQTVEALRKAIGVPVAGLFFTKKSYRSGATQAAYDLGVEIATCNQDQSIVNYTLVYQVYDPDRDARIRNILAGATVTVGISTQPGWVLTRPDGTVKSGS